MEKKQPAPPPNASPNQCLIVLVGLPGAGKSRVCEALALLGYTPVCQDTLRTRQRCISAAADALRAGGSPVIDRCNFDRLQRATWLGIAAQAGVPAVAVELAPPLPVCVARAVGRVGHPTLKPAEAEGVVRRIAAQFQAPAEREGFARVIRAATDEDADRVGSVLGAAPACPVPRADLAGWNPSPLPAPVPGGGQEPGLGAGGGQDGPPRPGAPPRRPGPGRGGGGSGSGPGPPPGLGGRSGGTGVGGGRRTGSTPSAAVAALQGRSGGGGTHHHRFIIPRHLDAPLGVDPRPIILFDLNGCLISRAAWAGRGMPRTVAVRPGVGSLATLLPPSTARLGVFTSATPPTVASARAALNAAAGCDLFPIPSLILCRDHTAPRPKPDGSSGASSSSSSSTMCAADRRAAFATVKPLARHFGDLGRVVLVDDEVEKVAPGEGRNLVAVPAWEAGEERGRTCPALPALAAALAALVRAVDKKGDVREHTEAASAAVFAAVEGGECTGVSSVRGGADELLSAGAV